MESCVDSGDIEVHTDDQISAWSAVCGGLVSVSTLTDNDKYLFCLELKHKH